MRKMRVEVQDGNDEDEVQHRRAKDRQQKQGEDQVRNRHHRVDEAAEDLIDPTPERRSHDTEEAADRESEQGRDEGDADRVAGAVDDAREEIAPQLIGAQEVGFAPGRKRDVRDNFIFTVGRYPRRKDGCDDIDADDQKADQCGGGRLSQGTDDLLDEVALGRGCGRDGKAGFGHHRLISDGEVLDC